MFNQTMIMTMRTAPCPGFRHLLIAMFISLVAGFGITTTATTPSFAQLAEGEPQPRLETEVFTLVTAQGSFDFTVEVADEPLERQMGLMFREKMGPKEGMIFDFQRVEPVSMWMANTPLSLDMVFIRPDGTVARIAKRTVPFSRDVISSEEPVSHVLELNAGITALIGMKAGDRIKHRFFDKD